MDGSVIWFGLLLLAVLAFFSTLGLALRGPTRARLADAFEDAGKSEAWEAFLVRQAQLNLAMAIVRSVAFLGLLLVVLHVADEPDAGQRYLRNLSALGVTLALVLIFGVAIPMAWAKYSGEWLIVRALPVMYGLRIICYPLIVAMQVFDPLIRRLSGVPLDGGKTHEDELEQGVLDAVSEMERQGVMDEEEKEMIESVIELRDTQVEHIMTPRTETVAIPRDVELGPLKELIREKGHSRIPVYEETIDTVLGVLYVKDLLHVDGGAPFDVTEIMRKALFIPETKQVKDLLHEFQEQKVHIAIVLDEYGGTAGLVTIEDILEELVGEIFDEYETPTPDPLKRIDEDTVEVDARMRIDDLNDELDIELPEDEDFETIGGLVFSTLGKIPKAGEHCEFENVALHVIDAESRRIKRIRMHITPVKKNGQD